MPALHELGFDVVVTAYGEEFRYDEPEDMGLEGSVLLQIKFDGGRCHHFDVEDVESVVLLRRDS